MAAARTQVARDSDVQLTLETSMRALKPPTGILVIGAFVVLYVAIRTGPAFVATIDDTATPDTPILALLGLVAIALPAVLIGLVLLRRRGVARTVIDSSGIETTWYVANKQMRTISRWTWSQVRELTPLENLAGSIAVTTDRATRPIAVGLDPATQQDVLEFARRLRAASA